MRIDPFPIAVRRNARRVPAVWLLTMPCLAGLASAAAAQQYKTDPIDPEATRNRTTASNVIRNPASYATEREKVLGYFKGSYFPEMTRTDPEALGQLGKRRSDFFRRILWVASEPMQQDLTTLAFAEMKRIVGSKTPYHPAVRYNAVLMIGMLDAQYAIEGDSRRPPKPLPAANKLLVTIVNAGAAGNKLVTPPLLAGALVGLERHAKYSEGLDVAAMQAAVLIIATADKPALEMDSDIHAWVRLQAATVLAQLGTVGANNQVYDALVKLLSTSKSLDDRCTIATLLAKLKYEGATIDGAALADHLLKLARDVAEAESKRATKYQDERVAGVAGPVRPGRGEFDFEPGGGFADEEEQDDFPRAHVLARLGDLKLALTDLKPRVPAEAQTKFDAILAEVNPAIETTADMDTVGLSVARALQSMAVAVKRLATPAAVAEADAEAEFAAPAEPVVDEEKVEPAPREQPAAEGGQPDEAPPTEVPPAAAPPPPAPAPADAPQEEAAAESGE